MTMSEMQYGSWDENPAASPTNAVQINATELAILKEAIAAATDLAHGKAPRNETERLQRVFNIAAANAILRVK